MIIIFNELYNNFFCILLSFVCYLQENFYGVVNNTGTIFIPVFYFIYGDNTFFSKTSFRETGCLRNPYFFWLLKHRIISSFKKVIRHYVASLITTHFPPNPYLGNQRISLGVASLLPTKTY